MLEKHESELRELEARNQELQELAKHQQFAPSDEVATFKILKNIREVTIAAVPVLALSERGMASRNRARTGIWRAVWLL